MSKAHLSGDCVKNHLLDSIDRGARSASELQPETVELALGQVLWKTEDTVRFIYFPRSAVLSLLADLSDGSSAEMATVGREGALGLIEVLGDGISQGRCVVQAAGTASRVPAELLNEYMERNVEGRKLTYRYIQFLFTQILQIGVCNAVHSVEARCCRVILMMRDHIGGNQIPSTHEFLAEMLGVHRPAVSLVARHLQDAGYIKQGRGVITITDDAHIEEIACECYTTLSRSFERLLLHSSN
jgi:CRP-like cAMP-binding protein